MFLPLAVILALRTAEPAPPPPAPPPPADQVRVVVPVERSALLSGESRNGRVALFLVSTQERLQDVLPMAGPFIDPPQPVYSVSAEGLTPGRPIEFDERTAAYPVPLAQLTGTFRAQAVFLRNPEDPRPLAPGNLASDVQVITLDAGESDVVQFELTQEIPAQQTAPPTDRSLPNLVPFSMRSALLSEALGIPVQMRASVALPHGWNDPGYRRRMWPVIFVIPDHDGVADATPYARMLANDATKAVAPQAAWVVLDPQGPWGHHGFVDSTANGPRTRALIEEFLPELERRFRLISRPEARILTGHGAGGWACLWLQLNHPEVFGACFSSAPWPVDFSAFHDADLYKDASFFTDAAGKEQPAYRVFLGERLHKVRMTSRDAAGLAYALSPEGRSGQPMDELNAMWSTLNPVTRAPRRMFDPLTGTIDRSVVRDEWQRFDLARLVASNPARFVPILRQRVRLLAAGLDNFYGQQAVTRLQAVVENAVRRAAAQGTPFPPGPGYITTAPEETFFTLPAISALRWYPQMHEHLQAHGLN